MLMGNHHVSSALFRFSWEFSVTQSFFHLGKFKSCEFNKKNLAMAWKLLSSFWRFEANCRMEILKVKLFIVLLGMKMWEGKVFRLVSGQSFKVLALLCFDLELSTLPCLLTYGTDISICASTTCSTKIS